MNEHCTVTFFFFAEISGLVLSAHSSRSYLNPNKRAARQIGRWIITGQSVKSTGEIFYIFCPLGSSQTNNMDLLYQELKMMKTEFNSFPGNSIPCGNLMSVNKYFMWRALLDVNQGRCSVVGMGSRGSNLAFKSWTQEYPEADLSADEVCTK